LTELGLRPALRADLPFIGGLCARSTSVSQEGSGYPRCEDETELLAELALYENSFEDNIFVVCDGAGQPVGFGGFLVSDTDDAGYLVGPMLTGTWRTTPVAADVVRQLVRLPIGGLVLLSYVEEDNVVLAQALIDCDWRPDEVRLEMCYDLTGDPPMETGTGHGFTVRRLTGPDDPAFRPTADLLGRQHRWSRPYAARLADYVDDGYHIVLAEQDDDLAGCAVWIHVEHTNFGRLDYLSVAEPFQRRSCGSLLTEHVLADAKHAEGVEHVYLSVDPANDVAHRLYLRHGFVDNVRSRKFVHHRD
jgi:ribosomal protein S18 acetylase RimI-like enzyme